LSDEILIRETEIAERIQAIALAVAADTPSGATLSVLALMDGAFMFAADLVRRLPIPVYLALVPFASVRRGGNPDDLRLRIPAGFPVQGADVLVVEDILDTGETLCAVKSHLEGQKAKRVRIAVLLDKPHHRRVDVRVDYVGFTIPDRWVVGFGLDVDGLHRNLPYITFVE
jgi:hypoxanthine phosphoribosyltransferase